MGGGWPYIYIYTYIHICSIEASAIGLTSQITHGPCRKTVAMAPMQSPLRPALRPTPLCLTPLWCPESYGCCGFRAGIVHLMCAESARAVEALEWFFWPRRKGCCRTCSSQMKDSLSTDRVLRLHIRQLGISHVRKSFELWNPGWEVRALDEKTLPHVLGDYCKQFSSICKAAGMGLATFTALIITSFYDTLVLLSAIEKSKPFVGKAQSWRPTTHWLRLACPGYLQQRQLMFFDSFCCNAMEAYIYRMG